MSARNYVMEAILIYFIREARTVGLSKAANRGNNMGSTGLRKSEVEVGD